MIPMLALVEITAWHWLGFIAFILACLALDLGLFHRRAHVVTFREALSWTIVWVSLALLFAVSLQFARGQKESLQFITGYLIELSLSMDNVFVIALIFGYFKIPAQYQHRVLVWGILGALVMRGVMIGAGAALINMAGWLLYVFGAFLVFSGFKMVFKETEMHPERNRVILLVRKFFPVSPELDGQKFLTTWQGRRALTPLALVLMMVETSDVIFALDSIPAIFSVTTKPFIIFSSNVFAILGLRSLYFVLAGAIAYFRYLNVGLALVLVFIGVKMLIDPHDDPPKWFQYDISTSASLIVVAGIILISMVISVVAARLENKLNRPPLPPPDPMDSKTRTDLGNPEDSTARKEPKD
jgi:tellurite resistance protein TerC